MTKQQENRAFAKMIKEFPKAFGRVSFRERLMLRTAFTYVVEEVQKQTRIARQDMDFIIRLTNDKLAGAENE